MKVANISGVCIYPEHLKKLKKYISEYVEYKGTPTTDEEVLKRIGDAQIIICFLTTISKSVILKSPKLKLISLGTTGFNAVPLDVAKEKGVTVCYTPLYATRAVAEHTIGLMLNAARFAFGSIFELRRGIYEHCRYQGKLLQGKTLGIIGYGKIGREVEKIAKNGFDMKVIYTDRNSTRKDLENLLQKSDVISLHVPLSSETQNMISEKEFKLMKDGVVIINTARGGIIDEVALIKNLDSGKIFAVGVDVLKEEPMDVKNPLIQHPRVCVTPHIAYNSDESVYERSEMIVENIISFIEGKPQNIPCEM